MTPPLAGLRVLDLTHFLSGPFCTMILGDLGAEVIKIEDPAHPDDARSVPPFQIHGQSTYYLSLNRNKKSLTLDLKTAEGLGIFDALVCKSDVVIDNFRPGVTAKLKVDYARLQSLNPRIICCSISGYGQTGPYSERPGYDYLMQAISGTMSLTGEPDQPPAKTGVSVVDHMGGIFAAVGILAAVAGRNTTGLGRHIDLALLDSQVATLSYLAANFLNHGAVPERQALSAHPYVVPCQNFRASDGWLSITPMAQKFWEKLCDAVARPELRSDPRFVSRDARFRHKLELLEILNPIFEECSVAEWVDRMLAHGVPAAPVNDLPKALADPQVAARNMIREMEHSAYGRVRTLGNPIKLSGAAEQVEAAPLLGEHTDYLLKSILDYSDVAVRELHARRIC